MKLADALALTLRAWGVRYVFGVSGANIEHVHDAIHRLGGDDLRAIMAKSEVGAAFMADGRARVKRTLGVCCATSGGGMMNLAVGIAESYAESVPVLALVGQVSSTLNGRGGFQDSSGIGRTVDAMGLFRSIAKYVARVEAGAFWETLHAAATAALSGRPGPAVLLFPRDVYEQEVGDAPSWFPESLEPRPAIASAHAVSALFEAMRRAQRAVMVLGTGVERCIDPEAVRAFAVRAEIPVVTTMASIGAFPNDHPLYLGAIGAAGHPSANAYVSDADLAIAVGTGLNVMTRHPLQLKAELAVVNVDPDQLLRTFAPAIVAQGDAGLVFRDLAALWDRSPFTHPPLGGYALTRYKASPPATPALLQSEAIEMLEAYLPERGHVLFDAGNCAVAALHNLTLPRGASSTIALGMGGMGYAIAGAIGAQLGDDARTVVICGDGAFLMLGFEIHTAVELGLPILFVVFNNGQHGMCVTRQELFFDGRVECARYTEVDVATVARGFGSPERLWVGRAATRAELHERLAEYDHARPGVLELVLRVQEMPPFAPFLREDAETYVVRSSPRRERSAA